LSPAVAVQRPEGLTVLVTGASGKTGRAVTRALLRRGVTVRAATRAPSQWTIDGALPVPVDMESGDGLVAALAGVDAVYHMSPNMHPDEVPMAERLAQAVLEAEVPRLVFHSILHPHHPGMPHHLRKGQAEELLRAALPGTTVLRPGAYYQNLLAGALSGRILVPYRVDMPFTAVDLADVADVAALMLTNPEHAGRTYDLVGPETLTVAEQAEQATAVLGRPVQVSSVRRDAWAAGTGADLREDALADLLAMFAVYDAEGLTGDSTVLTRLLGRPGCTWAQLLAAACTPLSPESPHRPNREHR
jgi:NAD(P)H dehydrogenase (quinone)